MSGRRVAACVLAGALLGLLEALVVAAVDHRMFLSYRELGRLLSATVSTGALALLVLGLPWSVLAAAAPAVGARGPLLAGLAAWPAFGWAAWLLTGGRRVAELPLRPVLVGLLGAVAAAAVALGIRAVGRGLRAQSRRATWAAMLAVAVVLMLLDSLVLRRLYPAFHLSLAMVTVVVAVQLARLIEATVVGRGRQLAVAAAALVVLSPAGVYSLLDSPTARFAVERCAPLTGKALAMLPRAQQLAEATPTAAPSQGSSAAARPGIDLQGRDVLLITVDALRADALRAYGGDGLTPAMDELARESAVFLRAYTPTPHTSYAVASLLTGKYMRGVMTLGGERSDVEHVTLPQVLRRYGYRTAGFYPPAIFFVDAQHFDTLKRTHFGFEYAKEMFASASDRVAQLDAYLQGAPPQRPVFAWVHLFEPHEPYEPPEGLARDDSPRGRYDGEVAAVDAAVARLVERFRRQRPQATVILTADHGEEFGDHGGFHHGTTLFDEQVRVPLLWSSPGVVRPRELTLAVDTVDLVPTILGALGIPPDARMRGDDLSAELAGARPDPGRRAYAAIDEARMVTDGRYKAICHRQGHCQLFDLVADPGELRDLAEQQPQRVAALRSELSAFVASIPQVEALALGGDSGFPQALARAQLGDASARAALPPLLGSGDARVREAAAIACGELGAAGARTVLARLRSSDESPAVRAAAAIAGLTLGDVSALADVSALVVGAARAGEAQGSAHVHVDAAAVALGRHGDRRAVPLLAAMAGDGQLDEVKRREAIEVLGKLADEAAVQPLIAVMDEVRLRPDASEALGRIGSAPALDAIAARFAQERYPESRVVHARALATAGDPRARGLIERFLGTTSSVPDGVAQLQRLGTLGRATACGADLTRGRTGVEGDWRCDARGCMAGDGARLSLRGGAAARRLVVRVHADTAGQELRLGDGVVKLRPGVQEVGVTLPAGQRGLSIGGAGRIAAFACVPVSDDIAPPPPVPWKSDAGVPPG